MLCHDCPKLDPEWAANNQVVLRGRCCRDEAQDRMQKDAELHALQTGRPSMNRHERRRLQKIK